MALSDVVPHGAVIGEVVVRDAVVVVEPGTGISPRQLVGWWSADEQARAIGAAEVRRATSAAYGPEVLDWVVIPIAVNLASSALYDLVKRVLTRNRPAESGAGGWLGTVEISHTVTAAGDPVVVIRASREPRS